MLLITFQLCYDFPVLILVSNKNDTARSALSNIVVLKMYRKLCFKSFRIIFAWFLFTPTDGELIVPCNVSVESEVRFVVNDYVATGIEK